MQKVIRSERLGESYLEIDHPTGLKILLCPMKGYQASYAYFATRRYGLETSTVILTILYFSALCFLLFYAVSMVIGTWRSSAEYNRSLWFRHLARVFMILMVFFVLKHDLNL